MADGEMRTHYSGQLGVDEIGQTVRVAGWVDRRRDHGGVIFIDVRDASGIVQAVLDPDAFPESGELRMEYCVSVAGIVRRRPEGTDNPEMATGLIELGVENLDILSPADPLPFMINDRTEADELTRLAYRYLDFRRPHMAETLRHRGRATAAMRTKLSEMGFLEVETPTLIASTPEGARDMLVPSRLRQGSFYALPQSPQLFKQLLMIGGVDRYYQIARCYRDEDFRSDRQIEFTQLDIEGSFWTAEDVQDAIESAVTAATEAVRGVAPETPFERLTYRQAMDRFGSDKPDMRFAMELTDLSDIFDGTEFRGFAGALAAGGVVRGINAGALGLSRGGLDALVATAVELGAKGMVWAVVEDDASLRSPVAKFLSGSEIAGISERLGASPGDTLVIVADQWRVAVEVLGQLRLQLGRPSGHDELRFLWVVDFPVFEETEDGGLAPSHHPFTQPHSVEEMRNSPREALSHAYDLVLNGSELGSGSVRIHDPEVQAQVFDILGVTPEDAEMRFGWFLRALRYGTPPHAGFAVGIDRLLAILVGADSIRDVIPFPKTQRGVDPMTGSPSAVPDEQLRELGVDLRPEVRLAMQEVATPATNDGGEVIEEQPPE